MRENCTYGSEGGVSQRIIPTPINKRRVSVRSASHSAAGAGLFYPTALIAKSCLTLMSDAQDAHDIVGRVVAIHGNVTRTALGDDQFSAKGIPLASD